MKPHFHLFALLVLVLALLSLSPAVFAEETGMSEPEAFRALFEDGPERLIYTDQVRNAVSMDQLQSLVDSIVAQLGSYVEAKGEANPYTLVFTNGEATAYLVLSDAGEVAGLQFTRLVPATGSLEEAVSALLALPGRTSVAIRKNRGVLVNRGGDEPLAVGSAFKLAVLLALEAAIESGETSWDSVVRLEEDDISLPSGVMQTWPLGTAISVESAAVLMMSQSDNTATDLLIRHVGRRAIEEYAPDSRPLLTTREFFLLKAGDQSAARDEYLAAPVAGRRRVLSGLEGELPPASLFAGGPVHPRIEWYFTTEQLAGIIEQIDRVDILAVNPGPINPGDWKEYGYKGGSEPGVINMTVWLVADGGDEYAVSATQSRTDDVVDTSAFVSAFQSILTHLR